VTVAIASDSQSAGPPASRRFTVAEAAIATERVEAMWSTLRGSARRFARVASRWGVLLDADDLAQHGSLAVASASRTYDPMRGAEFRAYAGVAIKRKMLSAVQRGDTLSATSVKRLCSAEKGGSERDPRNPRDVRVLVELHRRHAVRLDAPAYADQPDGPTVADTVVGRALDPFEAVARAEEREFLERAISLLTPPVAAVIRATYFGDLDRATIAMDLGMSVKAVEGAQARGLSKLREYVLALRRGETPVPQRVRSVAISRGGTMAARVKSSTTSRVGYRLVENGSSRRERIRATAAAELRRIAAMEARRGDEARAADRSGVVHDVARTLYELMSDPQADRRECVR
jgi:RNA polymerase sigma factor (sigma-70 family)